MTMAKANSGKMRLRLLVDRNSNRVIIGEAGKDLVDFLFHLISIPVGTVVKHLSKHKMVGSLGNIYESIEAMPVNYMEPNLNKAHVLNPQVSSSSLADAPFLLAETSIDDEPNISKVLYQCEYFNKRPASASTSIHPFVSNDPEAKCPGCRKGMKRKLTYVHCPAKKEVEDGNGSGYVKGLMTYIVMDNLQVKPMSTISSITLLSTFEIKDLSALETMEVFIGKEEALEILKASFITDRVLTFLFLGHQKA